MCHRPSQRNVCDCLQALRTLVLDYKKIPVNITHYARFTTGKSEPLCCPSLICLCRIVSLFHSLKYSTWRKEKKKKERERKSKVKTMNRNGESIVSCEWVPYERSIVCKVEMNTQIQKRTDIYIYMDILFARFSRPESSARFLGTRLKIREIIPSQFRLSPTPAHTHTYIHTHIP